MKIQFVIFIAILTLQACGSGNGDESNPVGLFNAPPADASVSLPSDSSVQNTMGLFNTQIGVSGIATTISSISKSISMAADAGCQQIDSHRTECNSDNIGIQNPLGGVIRNQLSFNCEDTEKGGRVQFP